MFSEILLSNLEYYKLFKIHKTFQTRPDLSRIRDDDVYYTVRRMESH